MAKSTVEVPLMDDFDDDFGGAKDEESGSNIENDFAYHNNVANASKGIRMGFLRKVYGLLATQLTITTIVAATCLLTPTIKEAVHAYPGLVMVSFVLSMVLLIALHFKRKETPMNLILLAAFTVVQAYTVGVIVTFYDVSVVLQAFFLTGAVVIGLTAFTFQTKKDFSGWGAGLMGGLMILIMGGFLQVFVGGEITQTAMAVGGALLFSGFIVYDTQMIMTRVSPEEYIIATIELYLDIINLFIEILKILERVNRR